MFILWNLHFQWKWAEVMACLAIDSTHPVPQQVFLVHCAPFLPAGCGAGNAFRALMEKEVHLISTSIPVPGAAVPFHTLAVGAQREMLQGCTHRRG